MAARQWRYCYGLMGIFIMRRRINTPCSTAVVARICCYCYGFMGSGHVGLPVLAWPHVAAGAGAARLSWTAWSQGMISCFPAHACIRAVELVESVQCQRTGVLHALSAASKTLDLCYVVTYALLQVDPMQCSSWSTCTYAHMIDNNSDAWLLPGASNSRNKPSDD